jgi:hypothetical protein
MPVVGAAGVCRLEAARVTHCSRAATAAVMAIVVHAAVVPPIINVPVRSPLTPVSVLIDGRNRTALSRLPHEQHQENGCQELKG